MRNQSFAFPFEVWCSWGKMAISAINAPTLTNMTAVLQLLCNISGPGPCCTCCLYYDRDRDRDTSASVFFLFFFDSSTVYTGCGSSPWCPFLPSLFPLSSRVYISVYLSHNFKKHRRLFVRLNVNSLFTFFAFILPLSSTLNFQIY